MLRVEGLFGSSPGRDAMLVPRAIFLPETSGGTGAIQSVVYHEDIGSKLLGYGFMKEVYWGGGGAVRIIIINNMRLR